ncbi:MAG: hypothetical protein ACKO5E_15285 [bacterium]
MTQPVNKDSLAELNAQNMAEPCVSRRAFFARSGMGFGSLALG